MPKQQILHKDVELRTTLDKLDDATNMGNCLFNRLQNHPVTEINTTDPNNARFKSVQHGKS